MGGCELVHATQLSSKSDVLCEAAPEQQVLQGQDLRLALPTPVRVGHLRLGGEEVDAKRFLKGYIPGWRCISFRDLSGLSPAPENGAL